MKINKKKSNGRKSINPQSDCGNASSYFFMKSLCENSEEF